MINLKVFGGILMILGSAVGAGILSLPIITAQEGFITASILLFITWIGMSFGAFYILEVALWLPENTNLVSMAKLTMGKVGQLIVWICYLLLLYALLCAYISGNTDVLQGILALIHIDISKSLAILITVFTFGFIVYMGIGSVDFVNRFLMTAKLGIFVVLMVLLSPYMDISKLPIANLHLKIVNTILVMNTAYGFATIIPSLRDYFGGDVKKMRFMILVGSLIPFLLYVTWVGVVHGVLTQSELQYVANSDQAITSLLSVLSAKVNNTWIISAARVFTSICMATSFLGVSLCLTDFLADGLGLKKRGIKSSLIYILTFGIPLVIVLLAPYLFVIALEYAGILCIILMMIMPALMAWIGRYRKNIKSSYQVIGGKTFLAIYAIYGIFLLLYAIGSYLRIMF